MNRELPKTYDPQLVEGPTYERWESTGAFKPSGDGEPFCIVLPPPNVTGSLHMGHALDHSVQDAIIRRKRMQGFNALWLPGTDHAGIATQNVVEKMLAKEGKSRHDLGREAFVEKVWAWKAESGGTITKQMRRLGDSVDWSRERFTMDEDLSAAVRTVFVRLFDEGLIYRGMRITHWCVRCHTAISDIEVEHSDVDGELIELHYPLTDGSGQISIMTTRVETMLGDTAVAVHPDDDRNKHLVGKTVTLPITGREIPIIADEAVDPEFGAGALKVTPAHDPIDYEIGLRHNIEGINILNDDGTLNENAGEYEGMDRLAARVAVLERLRADGRVGREERPFTHSVGHCSRCDTEIEPKLSEQWYVKVETLAKDAMDGVRDGRTSFIPKRFERNYFDWMENLRDWCISRQLWWGHRIPVWTCSDGHSKAYREDPSACADCGDTSLQQDPDVLDTWFSSALWPFSTLGWPEETDDLKTWYPTSVLVTGYDIITFWVSRMMMMGTHFMPSAPFADVHIHGMVRDGRGKKMSKSFGNVIDPLELIDKYGADAMRLTLLRGATLERDVPVDEKWIEGDRNFCNKLWNISRFVLMHLQGAPGKLPAERTLADRWILSRLDAVTTDVNDAMEAYDFSRAAQLLRSFVWSEFADWYLEWSKGRLYEGSDPEKADQASVLGYVLERALRLFHPIMPFITEEIWRTITGGETIMSQPWPDATGAADPQAEADMAFLQDVIGALRSFRSDHEIVPGVRPTATAVIADPARAALLASEVNRVQAIATWGDLTIASEAPPVEQAARLVLQDAAIHVPLAGLLDLDAERARLIKEREKNESDAKKTDAKLADEKFTARAPDDIVALQRERLAVAHDRIARINQALADLE